MYCIYYPTWLILHWIVSLQLPLANLQLLKNVLFHRRYQDQSSDCRQTTRWAAHRSKLLLGLQYTFLLGLQYIFLNNCLHRITNENDSLTRFVLVSILLLSEDTAAMLCNKELKLPLTRDTDEIYYHLDNFELHEVWFLFNISHQWVEFGMRATSES